MPQAVARVVEPDGMGQLRKEQTDHMTPRCEGARLFIDPVTAGQFFRQMRRDKFTKLMALLFSSCGFFGRNPPPATFFYPVRKGSLTTSCGTTVIKNKHFKDINDSKNAEWKKNQINKTIK